MQLTLQDIQFSEPDCDGWITGICSQFPTKGRTRAKSREKLLELFSWYVRCQAMPEYPGIITRWRAAETNEELALCLDLLTEASIRNGIV